MYIHLAGMELGLEFDDSLFEGSRREEKRPTKSYNAKYCPPGVS